MRKQRRENIKHRMVAFARIDWLSHHPVLFLRTSNICFIKLPVFNEIYKKSIYRHKLTIFYLYFVFFDFFRIVLSRVFWSKNTQKNIWCPKWSRIGYMKNVPKPHPASNTKMQVKKT